MAHNADLLKALDEISNNVEMSMGKKEKMLEALIAASNAEAFKTVVKTYKTELHLDPSKEDIQLITPEDVIKAKRAAQAAEAEAQAAEAQAAEAEAQTAEGEVAEGDRQRAEELKAKAQEKKEAATKAKAEAEAKVMPTIEALQQRAALELVLLKLDNLNYEQLHNIQENLKPVQGPDGYRSIMQTNPGTRRPEIGAANAVAHIDELLTTWGSPWRAAVYGEPMVDDEEEGDYDRLDHTRGEVGGYMDVNPQPQQEAEDTLLLTTEAVKRIQQVAAAKINSANVYRLISSGSLFTEEVVDRSSVYRFDDKNRLHDDHYVKVQQNENNSPLRYKGVVLTDNQVLRSSCIYRKGQNQDKQGFAILFQEKDGAVKNYNENLTPTQQNEAALQQAKMLLRTYNPAKGPVVISGRDTGMARRVEAALLLLTIDDVSFKNKKQPLVIKRIGPNGHNQAATGKGNKRALIREVFGDKILKEEATAQMRDEVVALRKRVATGVKGGEDVEVQPASAPRKR